MGCSMPHCEPNKNGVTVSLRKASELFTSASVDADFLTLEPALTQLLMIDSKCQPSAVNLDRQRHNLWENGNKHNYINQNDSVIELSL